MNFFVKTSVFSFIVQLVRLSKKLCFASNFKKFPVLFFVVIGAVFIPCGAYAAVVINEIAWMGTAANANDEWIELYNSGSAAVSLDGWVLTDSGSLTIALSGTIGSGAYALLERTDDTTVPDVSAFLIYTGALANDGRTLTLRRADSGIEDQVGGGVDWGEIGGDNTTKDTAQRTMSGWVTAAGTPGSENGAAVGNEENTNDTEDEEENVVQKGEVKGVSKTSSAGVRIELTPAKNELALAIDAQLTLYVNQAATFTVIPSGLGETLTRSLTYVWNFGDMHTASGTTVTHTFTRPGDYLVMVEGSFARHDALGRKKVTVLPVELTIERTEAGDLTIFNNAPYEVDLSHFTLRGNNSFTIPENTIVLPRGAITVDAARVGSRGAQAVVLYDARRTQVASTDAERRPLALTATPAVLGASTQRPVPETQQVSTIEAAPISVVTPTAFAAAETNTTEPPTSPTIPIGKSAPAEGGVTDTWKSRLPYLGLVAIMFLGVGALFFRRPETFEQQ